MKKTIYFLVFSCSMLAFLSSSANSDSTATDAAERATTVGGYGNAFYRYNSNEEQARINLERFVLFLGHKFNDKFSFFSELEVEDAKVSGGEEGGEVALEQCYIQYNCNKNHHFKFGLFLPQIGILNTAHLPGEYSGNERTMLETIMIPSTWRELGVGFFGNGLKTPLNYSLCLVNGLNSASFEHGNLIREGRYEGRDAGANNLAFTGSLSYAISNFTFQLSAYYGGTVDLKKADADSIGLDAGPFGTPVALGEFDIRYKYKRCEFKALATIVSIPDAEKINNAYGSNTPESAFGFYAEAGYAIHENENPAKPQRLLLFARYENLNLNRQLPSNGIDDKTIEQQHIIIGLNYQPIHDVVFKADVHLSSTGAANPALMDPESYEKSNTVVNLGFGYEF